MSKKYKFLITIILSLLTATLITGCDKSSNKDKVVVEENMIIGKDYKLPYFDFGEGEKNFILLPGASMTSILESKDGVEALFSPYTSDYHIYVFDVPEDLDSIKDIKHLANIIDESALALNIKSADIYGASMGGMIGQEMAISCSDLVNTLTIASSMSRNNDLSKEVISKWSSANEPEELARLVNSHIYSQDYYDTYIDILHSLESSATSDGVKRFHNLTRMIKDFSVYDELDKIKCPVYIFAGSADNVLGVEASIEISEKLNCFIKIFDGYSHAVYDEYPNFYDEVFTNLK